MPETHDVWYDEMAALGLNGQEFMDMLYKYINEYQGPQYEHPMYGLTGEDGGMYLSGKQYTWDEVLQFNFPK